MCGGSGGLHGIHADAQGAHIVDDGGLEEVRQLHGIGDGLGFQQVPLQLAGGTVGGTQQGADGLHGIPLIAAVGIGNGRELGGDAGAEVGGVAGHGGEVILPGHIQHGLGLDAHHLAVVLQPDLVSGSNSSMFCLPRLCSTCSFCFSSDISSPK